MREKLLKGKITVFIAILCTIFALPNLVVAQKTTKEAYVVVDGTTLTFYYDTQKDAHTGKTVYGIYDKHTENENYPAWAGYYKDGIQPNTTTTKVVFDDSFGAYRPKNTRYWFANCTALKEFEGLNNLNTSEVTEMVGMFYYCKSLTSLDLTHFNTSQAMDMSYLFSDCLGLSSLDLTHFDTNKVTDMSYMFANCSGFTSLDVTPLNTAQVTSMKGMFSECTELTSLNVSSLNTAQVTTMSSMFQGCESLTSLDLSHFNTDKVKDMYSMFAFCSNLTSLDITHFNTSQVVNMKGLFSNCSSLESIDLSNLKTDQVTNMYGMFAFCFNLKSLDLTHFKTDKVTNTSFMFFNCAGLNTIYCNDTWSAEDSGNMFLGSTQLKGAVSYDESKIDVSMANPDTGYFTRKKDSAIDLITTTPQTQGVYDLQGIRQSDDLESLPTGVYIVYGKKMLIER